MIQWVQNVYKEKIYSEVTIFSYIIFTAFVVPDIAYLHNSWCFPIFSGNDWEQVPFFFMLPYGSFIEQKGQEEDEKCKVDW